MRLAKVEIEGVTPPVSAYLAEERWNGWVCPYFTKEQAEALAASQSEATLTYDEAKDTYVANLTDNPSEYEYYPGEDILVDGVTLRLYPIGTYGWCWDESTMGRPKVVAKSDPDVMRDAFAQAIRSLRACADHWDETAVAEYRLSESFDDFVERLAESVVFTEQEPQLCSYHRDSLGWSACTEGYEGRCDVERLRQKGKK